MESHIRRSPNLKEIGKSSIMCEIIAMNLHLIFHSIVIIVLLRLVSDRILFGAVIVVHFSYSQLNQKFRIR